MRARCGVGVVLVGLAACSATPKPAPLAPPTAEPAATPARAALPALPGRWVEFLALSGGGADTQCYAFFDDGRFGWHAAAAGSDPDARRWGHYRVEDGAL